MTKQQTKELDILWAKAVKLKAKDKCEYSGQIGVLHSHHIFSRSNRTTRWDLDNGVCLKPLYHSLGNWSAHKSPIEFIEWIKKVRGETWYQKLRLKANQTCKPDYNLEKLYLEKEIKKWTKN